MITHIWQALVQLCTKLFRDNFQLIKPNAQIAQKVRAAQLDIAVVESRMHFLGAIASLTFCYWVFSDAPQPYLGLIWWGCATPLLLINYIFQWRVFRFQKERFSIQQWERFTFFMYAGWGCIWALAPWLFLPGIDNVYGLLIFFLTCLAICVTVILAASVYPASYLVFTLPIMVSSHVYLMSQDLSFLNENRYLALQGIIPFFALFLTMYMFKLRQMMHANIVLRLENEQANINKSQFLAAASHDIRQPLQAANFYWEDLTSHNKNIESYEKLGICLGNLSDLLDNILDISRLDAQSVKNNPKHIQLTKVVSELVTNFMPIAEEKGIKLEFDNKRCCVYADPILLERVIANLISNAINYTNHGKVYILSTSQSNQNLIMIRDTGIGIPENEQRAIFDEFYQLDNPERDRRKGLGLGLSIVKRLCNIMGCALSLESKPGSGSTFSLLLPEGNLDLVETNDAESGDINKKLSILLIEDEAMVGDALLSLFKRWNMEGEHFETQDAAVNFLSQNPSWVPDCIISDYRLRQNKTGVDAIKAISRLLNQEIPAILLTGDTHPERIQEATNSGYTLVHKPVKPAYLRTAIINVI